MIPGKPRGKARPRFYRGHAYTEQETREYERLAATLYMNAANGMFFPAGTSVFVSVKAVYPIPKRATKKTREEIQRGDTLPFSRPDIDNVLKIILDSLNGVAYVDDTQVCSISASKAYGDEPCVFVSISDAQNN